MWTLDQVSGLWHSHLRPLGSIFSGMITTWRMSLSGFVDTSLKTQLRKVLSLSKTILSSSKTFQWTLSLKDQRRVSFQNNFSPLYSFRVTFPAQRFSSLSPCFSLLLSLLVTNPGYWLTNGEQFVITTLASVSQFHISTYIFHTDGYQPILISLISLLGLLFPSNPGIKWCIKQLNIVI